MHWTRRSGARTSSFLGDWEKVGFEPTKGKLLGSLDKAQQEWTLLGEEVDATWGIKLREL